MIAFGAVIRLALVVALPVLAASCGTGNQMAAPKAAAEQSGAGTDQPGGAASDQTGAASALAKEVSPDYRISPRDIIEIAVFQVPDLNKTVQVSGDGNISLPLIGKTQIAGKTTQEAEKAIGDKLQKSYLRSPQVSIFVKQYGQRVTVSGEVKTPRVLAVEGAVTLTQAVANAGGLSDLGDINRVHIARAVEGRVEDVVYDLGAIQAGKAPDPTLRGGDIVVVEESGTRVALKNVKDLLPFAILSSII